METKNIIKDIKLIPHISDEPKYYCVYSAIKNLEDTSIGYGISFQSPDIALLKSLTESMERASQSNYQIKNSIFVSYDDILKKTNALNPNIFKKIYKDPPISWNLGKNFFTNSPIYIPSQLIYINYLRSKKEPLLIETNSNGTAGGFNHESALTRAIFELIERDSLMTIFLTKSKVKKIRIGNINNASIQNIVKHVARYNLEIALFDITSDLGIPTFMGFLIDKTGIGPSITIGSKCSLDVYEAIIGALTEAFLTRIDIRKNMLLSTKFSNINPDRINTIRKRGLYWAPLDKLSFFNYLLNQPEINFSISFYKKSNNYLQTLKKILKERHMIVIYIDITKNEFKKIGYTVYKVIIPDLQILYLNEKNKSINWDRLKSVSKYFGMDDFVLNTYPHPIL